MAPIQIEIDDPQTDSKRCFVKNILKLIAALALIAQFSGARADLIDKRTGSTPPPAPEASKDQRIETPHSAPDAVVAPPPTWEVRIDDGSINTTMRRWAFAAHWQLSWEVPVDYPAEVQDVFKGSYEDAVRRVINALKISPYPPWPCFHENNVLRIVRRVQGDNSECLR